MRARRRQRDDSDDDDDAADAAAAAVRAAAAAAAKKKARTKIPRRTAMKKKAKTMKKKAKSASSKSAKLKAAKPKTKPAAVKKTRVSPLDRIVEKSGISKQHLAQSRKWVQTFGPIVSRYRSFGGNPKEQLRRDFQSFMKLQIGGSCELEARVYYAMRQGIDTPEALEELLAQELTADYPLKQFVTRMLNTAQGLDEPKLLQGFHLKGAEMRPVRSFVPASVHVRKARTTTAGARTGWPSSAADCTTTTTASSSPRRRRRRWWQSRQPAASLEYAPSGRCRRISGSSTWLTPAAARAPSRPCCAATCASTS